MRSNNSPALADLPHSWSVAAWPKEVFPNDSDRGRWIVRAYRRELMEEGALARAGKSLIVIGRGYGRWLAKRATHVPGYCSNNPRMRSSNAA